MRRAILPLLLIAATCRWGVGHAQDDAPGPTVEPAVPSVPDATRLYTLDAVTVVYPAGPGEDREANRRSAQFRADFLERVQGVPSRVVADDAVTADHKIGNLLVLGWGNRLLGSTAVPSPFVKLERGFRFLGIDEPDPSAQLLFFARSPFQAGKFLCFWSRIDPEMDRFQPLPLVGSNWAVIRDFLVVRQGMFLPESTWPPARNPDAEADHDARLLEIEIERRVRRTDHYEIYYLPSERLDRDIDAVALAREKAFARAVQIVGPPRGDGYRIRLFLYRTPEDKKERTGIEDPAHSVPRSREMHLVLRHALSESPHEDLHVVARASLGPSFLSTMYEGLAIAEDGVYAGRDLDLHAALLDAATAVPKLDDLFHEARMRALKEDIAFPASGLAVRWLRDGGAGRLEKAFGLPQDAGVAGLAEALGVSPQEAEAAFAQWIKRLATARRSDVLFLKAQADAGARYAVGDYAGVAAALEKALKYRPDDAQTLFNLASAWMRTGAYAKAERSLRRIPDLPLAGREAHLVVFSHYQLGRLFDVQGRRAEAVEAYQRVLALPDANGAHQLAREAMERPVTRDQLE
jgi:tetratricopeptide (TPR) repeat protein